MRYIAALMLLLPASVSADLLLNYNSFYQRI